MALEIAPIDAPGARLVVLETSYFAIPPARVATLMTSVGFEDVRRIDGRFFLPPLAGTRREQARAGGRYDPSIRGR